MAKYIYNDIFDSSVIQGIETIEKKINNLHTEIKQLSNIKIDFIGGENLQKINKQLETLTQKEKELKKVKSELHQTEKQIEITEKKALQMRKKAEKQADQFNKEKIKEKIITAEYKKQLREEIKLELQLQKIENKEIKTLRELQFAVSALKKKRDRLNLTTKDGVREYERLNAKILEYNNRLKKADYSVGFFQRNVGNYPFRKLQGAFTGIGKAIGIAGVAFAGFSALISSASAATSQFIEAANQQYLAERKLSTVMKQRMNATDSEIQSILKLTSAQQQLGVIGDEVQIAGAQQLATFSSQTATLQMLIPAMNNLIAQQKGVNATQGDAVNIANLLGKALQGQVGALTRVGITLTDEQKKLLKTGNEMQRASVLAQIITDNVGNMNQALANTPQGQYQQLKNELGDYAEELGRVLLPLVIKVTKAFTALAKVGIDVIKSLQKMIAPHKELQDVQNMYLNANQQVIDQMSDERAKIEQLIALANNENIAKEKRLEAIKQLNAISPEYLGNITLETLNTKETTDAINQYIDALEKKTKAQLAQAKVKEILEKEFEAQLKLMELQKQFNEYQEKYQQSKKTNYAKNPYAVYGQTSFAEIKNDIQKQINEQKNIIEELGKQKSDFINILNELGVSFDFGTSETQKKQTQNFNNQKKEYKKEIDALTQFKLQQQRAYLEKQLALQQQYGNDEKTIQLELTKFKKQQLQDLITFTEKYDKKYIDEQLKAKIELYKTSQDIESQQLAMKTEAFQKEYNLLQKNDEAILIQMRKQGAKEVEIEKKKIELKIAELQKYLDFKKSINADKSEIKDLENQIEALKLQFDKLNATPGEKKSLIDRVLGENWKDKLQQFVGVFRDLANNFLDVMKNLYDAQIEKINQLIDKSKERQQVLQDEIDKTKEALQTENEAIAEKIKLGVAYDTRKQKELQKELARKQKELQKEKEVEQKKLAERKKIEEKQRRMDIMRAEINTAAAVINALATVQPFALALVMATLAGAKGAIEIAKIKTAKFEKGTEYVERGNNPIGTDTIPAMVDEGERIIPKKLNKKIPRSFPNKLIPLAVEQYLTMSALLGYNPNERNDKSEEILKKIAENTGQNEIRDANGNLIEKKINDYLKITYK